MTDLTHAAPASHDDAGDRAVAVREGCRADTDRYPGRRGCSEDVIDGDDVTGWTDLWERVETVLDQCARSADLAVAAARSARARLDALERQVTAARRERDCAIQDAHSLGVPIARLVEVTGIQRAMVHRIATRSTVSGSSPGAGMSHGGSNS